MKLKIGLIQMRSEKGAIIENLKAISGFINKAHKRGVDILGLPEGSITGYNNPIKYPQTTIDVNGPEVAEFLRLTKEKEPIVLAGLIEKNPDGKPFITQVIAHNGKLLDLYRKKMIIDDDNEWFSPGNEVKAFTYKGLKYGIAICSDMSGEDIFAEYARQGAKIVFELAAPGLLGDQANRNWESGYRWFEGSCRQRFVPYCKKYNIWIAVATAAGRTSDEDFPGGGYVFAPNGRRVYATKDWHPGEVYLQINLESRAVKEI
jgi:predicted amidohydrolase